MNPSIFTEAKTSEDLQEFVDEVHKILVDMRGTDIEKVELASYQLKDVVQTWWKMWQDSRVRGGEHSHESCSRQHLWKDFSPKR